MSNRFARVTRLAAALALLGASTVASAQPKPIALPAPDRSGGKPLMQVLGARKSQREFRRDPLPLAVVSNLLWAAFGVSRPDGRRTAPSASNRQEIEIYVALPEALYLYDAAAHALKPIVAGDLRGATGTQPFVADAALDLVFVADLSKTTAEDRVSYAYADTGFIAENVYLFCASEGLATVVRASVDREALARRIALGRDQRIILAQSVGYPPR